jgi:hypothetical protein
MTLTTSIGPVDSSKAGPPIVLVSCDIDLLRDSDGGGEDVWWRGNLKDFARPRCRWLGDKRMSVTKIGLAVVVRIHLVKERHKRQAVVNMVINV